MLINSLPSDKLLKFVQIESIWRRQNKCDWKLKFVFARVEIIVGKRENAGN